MQNPIGVDFGEQPGRAPNIWETQMLSSDITTTFWPQYFGLPSPKNLWQSTLVQDLKSTPSQFVSGYVSFGDIRILFFALC